MKEHTIIFVPHARAKFRKWRFTSLQAGVVLGSLAILTLGGITATVLYLGSSFDQQQLDLIEQENEALRRENQQFERTILEIEEQLKEFDSKVDKLAIVAGVSELTSTSDAGIGGSTGIELGSALLGTVDLPESEEQQAVQYLEPAPGSENLDLLESWTDQLGDNLGTLQEKLQARQVWISQMPAITPVKGLLTSGYRHRIDPFTKKRTFHAGIDIVAPRGKEVVAPGDGIVIKTGRLRGLGKAVYVSHGFGITTRYGHLQKILVEEGQRIQRGDVLGQVGNTGRSTGYHLHYEVRVDGRTVNPLGYILDSTSR